MPGGHAETPLYGWSWPSDKQTLRSHDWPSTETRYVVVVFLIVPLHCLAFLRHPHLHCDLHYSPKRLYDLRLFFVFPSSSAGTTLESLL
jgi:hypothetical protein